MEIQACSKDTEFHVRFVGEMNIYFANEIKEALLSAVEQQQDIVIDLSEVSEIDSTGLQLLRATAIQIELSGRTLNYIKNDFDVKEKIELCGMETMLGYT